MKTVTKALILPVSLIALFLVFFIATPVSALSIYEGINSARGANVPGEIMGDTGLITTIVNIMLFIVGALSVIMLIIGGIRYTISGGNSAGVTAAKNTILYAIVGLIIAFLSYAAVQFVMSAITGGGISGFGGGFSDR